MVHHELRGIARGENPQVASNGTLVTRSHSSRVGGRPGRLQAKAPQLRCMGISEAATLRPSRHFYLSQNPPPRVPRSKSPQTSRTAHFACDSPSQTLCPGNRDLERALAASLSLLATQDNPGKWLMFDQLHALRLCAQRQRDKPSGTELNPPMYWLDTDPGTARSHSSVKMRPARHASSQWNCRQRAELPPCSL